MMINFYYNLNLDKKIKSDHIADFSQFISNDKILKDIYFIILIKIMKMKILMILS